MSKKIFKSDSGEDTIVMGGEGCFVYPDGSVSDAEFHAQIMEGVDPNTGNEYIRLFFPNHSKEWLDEVFPLPANPDDVSNYDINAE